MRIGYYGNSIGDHFGVANIFLEGKAPGLFIGYRTQGVVQEGDVVDGKIRFQKEDGTEGFYTSQYSTKVGDLKFVDLNGDGEINDKDRTIIGDPNPGFIYGFSTNLKYKNFALAAAFTGVQGRDILNTNNRYLSTPAINNGMLLKKAFQGRWTAENPNNLYPANTFVVNNYILDRYVEDASYLRCSDITLSYNFEEAWMKAIKFRSASVFFSVKNAFIITNYSGYDPEVNSFAFDGLRPGIDMRSYPNARSFVFGLNIGF